MSASTDFVLDSLERGGDAGRSQSRFIARVSRDLRVPLRDLLTLGNGLLEGTLGKRERETVSSMCESAHDALSVVNNLLDLSRFDAGLSRLSPRAVDLRLVTEDVIEIYSAKADRKHVDLALLFSCDLPKRIAIDAGRYRQLLCVFVENSIAATTRGHILVSVAQEPAPDGYIGLLIQIEDTGMGMTAETAAALVACRESESPGGGGAGLGITLAHRLLAAMGGTLAIESKLREGTSITLRLEFPRDPNAWQQLPAPAGLAGKRVLVADSSPVIRRAFQSMFENSGIEVLEATDARSTAYQVALQYERPPVAAFLSAEIAAALAHKPALPCATALLARSIEAAECGDRFRTILRRNPRRTEVMRFLAQVAGIAEPLNCSRSTPDASGSQTAKVRALLVAAAHLDAQPHPALAILEQAGYPCSHVPSAEAALASVSQIHYDVLLIDDDAAHSNAFELADQICARQPRRPSAVAVIADPADTTGPWLSKAGSVTDLIAKPIHAVDLLKLLAAVAQADPDPVLAFNYEDALRRCGGDPVLLAEVAREFSAVTLPHLNELSRTVASRSIQDSLEIARQFTVSAKLIGAEQLVHQLPQLCESITLCEWAEAAALVTAVKSQARYLAVLLRALAPAAAQQAQGGAPEPVSVGARVLTIQNDALTGYFIQACLGRAGYEATACRSLREAQAALSQQSATHFSCVVLDVSISNALTFLDWVRAHETCLVPVVVASDSDAHLIQGAMRAGAAAVLNTPLDRTALEATVSQAVELTVDRRRTAEMRLDVEQVGAVQRALIQTSIGSACSALRLFLHPRHQAGGDFFSYFQLSESRSAGIITDVSGHDLKSAFVSAHLQGMIRALLEAHMSSEAVFARANAFLLNEWTASQGVGISLSAGSVVFDKAAQQLEVVRCGTPAPVLTTSFGECATLAGGASDPLGWFADCAPERTVLKASCGSVIMWTDGVEELAAQLNVSSCALATALLRARSAGLQLAGIERANDDMLVASINLDGPSEGGSAEPVLNESYAKTDVEQIDDLQQVWKNSITLAVPDISSETLHDLLLCAREALINALRHGCRDGGTAALRLVNAHVRGRLVLQVEDDGPGHDFDPAEHAVWAAEDLIPQHRGLILMTALSASFVSQRRGAKITMEFINQES